MHLFQMVVVRPEAYMPIVNLSPILHKIQQSFCMLLKSNPPFLPNNMSVANVLPFEQPNLRLRDRFLTTHPIVLFVHHL